MPELPETETIARDLDGALRGAVVRSVHVVRGDVLRGASARALARRIAGAAIVGVSRRAKSIVLDLGAAGWLVVTPRFTGALLVDASPADPYTCLRLGLADGRSLAYRDVRRLGTVALLDDAALAAWDAALGPEPLDPALTPERFSGILRGSRQAVKKVLMDQRRLAGVGNIYANEACWLAGIRPQRTARALTREEGARVLDALRAVLRESIGLRGTTFRDYRDAFGGRGGYAARLRAYGRAGAPCARCGTPLVASHAVDGRQTVWCPERTCQR